MVAGDSTMPCATHRLYSLATATAGAPSAATSASHQQKMAEPCFYWCKTHWSYLLQNRDFIWQDDVEKSKYRQRYKYILIDNTYYLLPAHKHSNYMTNVACKQTGLYWDGMVQKLRKEDHHKMHIWVMKVLIQDSSTVGCFKWSQYEYSASFEGSRSVICKYSVSVKPEPN